MNILHITTHMGGGVGHAISDLVLCDNRNEHRITILQKPEKRLYIEKCKKKNIIIDEEPDIEYTKEIIRQADVVILHWWHHPIMCRFLYNFPKVPVRMILWSHISGCSYPVLTYQFANRFTKIFLTSKYSLENPYWNEDERKKIALKSSIIYGMGQLTQMKQKCDYGIKDDIIKIGYVGTLAKSKIHPEFPKICKKILDVLPNAEFYLLGDTESGEWIRSQAVALDIVDKIHFEGFVDNVNEWLISFDIFGYPLNPYHFGTTENSILEAMSVGLPVVLLDQATEKYIVALNEDGILAKDIEDYVSAVTQLARNKYLREKIGLNAACNVYRRFSFQDNLQNFQSGIMEASFLETMIMKFSDVLGKTSFDWFMSAVNGQDKEKILECQFDKLSPIYKEKSKSSVLHFANTYPEDERLQNCIKYIFK